MSRCGVILAAVGLILMTGCGGDDNPEAPKVTLVVDPNPDRINAPWTLVGPNGFSATGNGDRTFSDLDSGTYTLTWGDVNGWVTPSRNPYNQTIAQGATFVFSGTYLALNVDVVRINPEPDEVVAPWDLAGPEGFAASGAGDTTMTQMAAGQYTLTWGDITGWDPPTPNPDIKNLVSGQFIEFLGQYRELPPINTVTLNPNPNFISAPWNITGPGGFTASGNGDTTFVELSPGTYTVTWGDVVSYETPQPNPDVRTLQANGTLTFLGNYSRFVRIEAGTFTMGSPSTELGRGSDEVQHEVTITRPFLISKTETTQAEWNSVVPDSVMPNPSYFLGCDECPVESVSWFHAIQYCNMRSQQEGYSPAYVFDDEEGVIWNRDANGYRLPTEAEWEYACRAGTQTAYYNGGIAFASPSFCYRDPVLEEVGWYCDNSDSTTHVVGAKEANPWGLFDSHGNVWEWCWDYYGPYPSGPQNDPAGPADGVVRVMRGGSWYLRAEICRAAKRGRGQINKSDPRPLVGFRLVRSLNE